MTEIWEKTFSERQLMWGLSPTQAALLAKEVFVANGVTDVLIPGVGYGRNAKVFLDAGMTVSGIEISETAIALARSELGLTIPIVHGSVTDMPFDDRIYDGIFCYGLLYLLDGAARAKVLRACWGQLAAGGTMIFTVISKTAPMYGQGPKLGEDWYEIHPGLKMFFYDEASVAREFGEATPGGTLAFAPLDEPLHTGSSFPFFQVVVTKLRQ